jgi:hypothetical protein
MALEIFDPRIRDLLASIVALDDSAPDCPSGCATYCERTRRLAFIGGALGRLAPCPAVIHRGADLSARVYGGGRG